MNLESVKKKICFFYTEITQWTNEFVQFLTETFITKDDNDNGTEIEIFFGQQHLNIWTFELHLLTTGKKNSFSYILVVRSWLSLENRMFFSVTQNFNYLVLVHNHSRTFPKLGSFCDFFSTHETNRLLIWMIRWQEKY